ncbi:AMP-binding protein [Nonomuraea sp. NPDC050536]|uniref:AMP-binding protein n=1 Tax=Nonomuraea sp. NPDC050536 TaxID=3364366 RepID=UPI0037C8A2F0
MTWTELVLAAVPRRGDQPAVSDVRTGEMLSYAAFNRRVTHTAAGFRRHGLRYGDRVHLDIPFGAMLPVLAHAVAWAGGIAVLRPSGTASMLVTLRDFSPGPKQVFTVEPVPGATPYAKLLNDQAVEFGPLAGPALSPDGERVFDNDELAADLRRLARRLPVGKDDVVLAAVTDRMRGLRTVDLALMAGAHVIIAHEPTLIGCRVLAQEHHATLVVAPNDIARRLLGASGLRVVDERAIISSLGL